MQGHMDFTELRIAGDRIVVDGKTVAILVRPDEEPHKTPGHVRDRFVHWIETFGQVIG